MGGCGCVLGSGHWTGMRCVWLLVGLECQNTLSLTILCYGLYVEKGSMPLIDFVKWVRSS